MRLLVVEDDARLGRALRRMLERDHHIVELSERGFDAIEVVSSGIGVEAMILDIGLPDISGVEVARRLRRAGHRLPILMLTARDATADRVAGLDAGADDYLVKPFAYEELLARLRALDRRAAGHHQIDQKLVNGPILLDQRLHRVDVAGRVIELTRREFTLLECLLRHPGQVLSRDQLLDYVWPFGGDVAPNTVEAYIHLLRRKLGPDAGGRIVTVHGTGYRMTGP
ncbi:MAG: response regulator transcription factor [Candidatus Limnocylindria bacterium]